MFEWTAFLADLVVISGVVYGGVYVIRRWKLFKWWMSLGYWLNAQEWGGRNDSIWFANPSCWNRVLPRRICRGLAWFFLLIVESPPESEEEAHSDHRLHESQKVLDSWNRITARHERRGWNHHPRYCYNPTNLRWCALPGCNEEATGRTIGEDTLYWCSEHREDVSDLEMDGQRGIK